MKACNSVANAEVAGAAEDVVISAAAQLEDRVTAACSAADTVAAWVIATGIVTGAADHRGPGVQQADQSRCIRTMSTFSQLGVAADIIQGLEELGIVNPTPVQESTIPFLLKDGGDLVAQAQTGTGKTAAFGVSLLAGIDPAKKTIQGLVIAPTRELAKQIGKDLFRYTKYSKQKIFVEVAGGGDKIGEQVKRLQRPTHIVVATPGRLLDLIKLDALSLESVKYLILDEADEMLSMGFKNDIARIVKLTASRKSTWLFSATFQSGLKKLVEECMPANPEIIKVDRENVVNTKIAHKYVTCMREDKDEFIADFLQEQGEDRGIIFCRTRAGAIRLGSELSKKGISVDVIQGDLSQKERDKIMRSFKKQRIRFLIATDVAARGIDIEGLSFVIHRQLPDQIHYYAHRAGRTARAGKGGTSICLIEPSERGEIKQLEQKFGLRFDELDTG